MIGFSARLKFFLLLTLLLFFIFMINGVEAQTNDPSVDGTFQISPLRHDWVVAPDDKERGVIYLKNNAKEAINVEVEVQDFSVNQDFDNSTNFFVPNENHPLRAYDVINWINIDKNSFKLEAGESKEVDFNVHIPLGTPTGGYYGVVFFTRKPIEDKQVDAPAQVGILTRLGMLLTFGVHGSQPINEQGSLKLFSPAKKVFIDNPISLNLQVTNGGNFPYKLTGSAKIYKAGKKVTTLEIDPRLFYPERTKNIQIPTWDASFFDIGKYDVKLNLISEDGSVVIDGTTSFWIIPWKIVAIVFFIVVVLLIIFNIGVSSGRQKIEKKERVEKPPIIKKGRPNITSESAEVVQKNRRVI